MCGGELLLSEGANIAECDYCGSIQTVPTVDDDKKQKLYDRANKLRFHCDFDKAAAVFENIVNEFPDDAESYWGLLLCKYGIEYVDDPITGKKVPTCHRSSFESIMDDPDFDMVMENSESDARNLYRSEAKQIEELRKNIVEVSEHEQPYDIFICYKETDDSGQRTIDSVIAQDVYDALIGKGYRVFFSRISLEDKLGTEYEPYIFAALNSAKIMLAFGTTYDYFNAVWVKNEWSRFLKLMANDKEKYLIPCFKNIDAYDIPKEFAKFQAQDMGKVGAIQDLVRGIDKILRRNEKEIKDPSHISVDSGLSALNAQTEALVKRGFMALEDGEFDRASDFFEQALNNDAECGLAYFGKALSKEKVRNSGEFIDTISERIKSNTKYNNVVIPGYNLVEAIREADLPFGLFKEMSDSKLIIALKKENSDRITLRSGKDYYEKILLELENQNINCINSRELERAMQYADANTENSNNMVLSTLKANIKNEIQKEDAKERDIRQQVQKEREILITKIKDKLGTFVQENPSYKEDYENEYRKAEIDAENRYREAIAKYETDYNNALAAFESDYARTLELWRQKKNDYETNYSVSTRKQSALKEEIEALEKEKETLKGIFSGRRRKEIDGRLFSLNEQIKSIIFPIDPGEKPEKGTMAEIEGKPERESFQAILPDGMVDMDTKILHLILPCFSTQHIATMENVIPFGKYAYYENGEENNIYWQIIGKEDDRVLLISNFGLDVQPYNNIHDNTTWANCSLRKWLNDEFYNTAFSNEERALIVTSQILADKNPKYKSEPGKQTKDKVFLLSVNEVEQYILKKKDRLLVPTPYAKEKMSEKTTNDNWWWLRTPGQHQKAAVVVSDGGSIFMNGCRVDSGKYYVRPAIWVKNLALV